MFGHRRKEVTGDWRKLHNEGPGHKAQPNIIMLIMSSMMSSVGMQHV
jgi:hypothetical protein